MVRFVMLECLTDNYKLELYMSKDSVKSNSVNSADYIKGLPFDYIETYSLQRGEEYDALIQHI